MPTARMPGIFEPRLCGLRAQRALANGRGRLSFAPGTWTAASCSPGENFHFDIHLFDLADPVLSYFIRALSRLADEGTRHGPEAAPCSILSSRFR